MSDMFKVSSSGLNLRSTPVVDPANVLVILAKGQVVTKLAENPGNDFWEVSTIVDGATFQGFVSSRFLSVLGETLTEIVASGKTLTFNELGDNVELVFEIQKKLRNLGLYYGGPWIDGDLGDQSTGKTWKGLQKFSTLSSLSAPSIGDAMNPSLANALLKTQQIPSILDAARDTDNLLKKLNSIQPGIGVPSSGGNGPAVAFLNRTIRNSSFEQVVKSYPANLAQQIDGTNLVSYGKTFQLTGSGVTVTFEDYPTKGSLPNVDSNGLDFLDSSIEHACVCVGSFIAGDDDIKTHWLGKKYLEEQQFLSSTKFIGVLNAISQLNAMHPNSDVDNCVIGSGDGGKRYSFSALAEDIVTYAGNIGSSNSIAAMFKRFSTRKDLEDWTRGITGNQGLSFRGYYGPTDPPLFSSPIIFDTMPGNSQNVLRSAPEIGSGPNSISAYDLVRLISMLGWHLHLPASAQLPGAQWNSLESVVRAMGLDIGRYIDVALETLGLVNVVTKPVIISKVGWSDSAFTYVALVKLVDNRQSPAKLRTLAMALWTSVGSYKERDSNMATAVTEIMRRIFTEELA
jgi:peptidoglycan hydrolase-like protein with peptidoglycan-binding domain